METEIVVALPFFSCKAAPHPLFNSAFTWWAGEREREWERVRVGWGGGRSFILAILISQTAWKELQLQLQRIFTSIFFSLEKRRCLDFGPRYIFSIMQMHHSINNAKAKKSLPSKLSKHIKSSSQTKRWVGSLKWPIISFQCFQMSFYAIGHFSC